jgi:molybdopterin molybdotransferase
MAENEPRSTQPAWNNPATMLGVDEARARILTSFAPLAPEPTPILDALGMVLAEDVVSADDLPPFRNSAMDGYAIRSADTIAATEAAPVRLVVRGEIPAGSRPTLISTPGTAIRIMTGAVIPDGADAVVRFEKVIEPDRRMAGSEIALSEASILVSCPVHTGENVRNAGEDVAAGTQVLASGTLLKPAHIGLFASINRATVNVVRRPIIAILSTGDEVVEIGPPLELGQIRNSNSYTLAAMTMQFGGIPRMVGIAMDSEDDVKAHLRACQSADLLVTSGGVSVGDFDLVKRVLQSEGHIDIWQIRMKPGKPLAFGSISDTPLLGLPGNPVAAAVAFAQFGRPVIRRMLGMSDLSAPTQQAKLTREIENRGRRRHFVRGIVERVNDGYIATPSGRGGTAAMNDLASANCFIIVPEDQDRACIGDTVVVELFDGVSLD